MKTKIELYLTDSAPNGTNDLCIVNGDTGELIQCIPEATFGYPRNTRTEPNAMVYAGSEFVGPIQTESVHADDTYLYSVSKKTIKEYLAVSPVDPDGSGILSLLKKAGIK